MFRFLCSADCCDGLAIKNLTFTNIIHDFINNVTSKGCNIELSDHSLAAVVNTWNKDKYGIECPFIISNNTTYGNYSMIALKVDLINSGHQILKIVGQLSDSDTVNIKFANMIGTKIYLVNTKSSIPIQILSKGKKNKDNPLERQEQQQEHQLNMNLFKTKETILNPILNNLNLEADIQINQSMDFIESAKSDKNIKNFLDIQHHGLKKNDYISNFTLDDPNLDLVHTIFKLNNATVYCSATHWCNLLEVESDVNMDTLRTMTQTYCGEDALDNLNTTILSGDIHSLKRDVSYYIREISSGGSENYIKKKQRNKTT